jgi:hypothetical protein
MREMTKKMKELFDRVKDHPKLWTEENLFEWNDVWSRGIDFQLWKLLAEEGYMEKYATSEILALKDDCYDTPLAHILALNGTFPERLMTPEILAWEDNRGETVAYDIFCMSGTFPERLMTPEILAMKDGYGRKLAHILAEEGLLPEKFMTPEILALKDRSKRTVQDILIKKSLYPSSHDQAREWIQTCSSGADVSGEDKVRERVAIQYFRNELGKEVGDMLVSTIRNESRNTARDMQEEDIRGR